MPRKTALPSLSSTKREKGQFYTTQAERILEGLVPVSAPFLWSNASGIVEPFAGQGNLVDWIREREPGCKVEAWDIDPKAPGVEKRDTLLNPPDFTGKWVITNPPYLARNKSADKTIFDKYNTNDLYKCFITLLTTSGVQGGLLIVPAGFFLSSRELDVRCRGEFMRVYRIERITYFEETVFDDTSTTVVAFTFTHTPDPLDEQTIPWTFRPSGETQLFTLRACEHWLVGGDMYALKGDGSVKVSRYIEGIALKKGVQLTFLTLTALDSGTSTGPRISLVHDPGIVYPAKDHSRTYATLCVFGKVLSEDDQREIAQKFNTLIEAKRMETHSLFLPPFRESKEYSRKRIPFELVYQLVEYLISRE